MRARAATWFSRGVSLLRPEILCRLPPNGRRQVALTFDDGPTAEGTAELLELLGARGIKATFFLVGKNALAHPRLVRQLVEEGHLVGNHSFSHVDAWRAPPRVVWQ